MLLSIQTKKRRLIEGALGAEPSDGLGKQEFTQLFNCGIEGTHKGPTTPAKPAKPDPKKAANAPESPGAPATQDAVAPDPGRALSAAAATANAEGSVAASTFSPSAAVGDAASPEGPGGRPPPAPDPERENPPSAESAEAAKGRARQQENRLRDQKRTALSARLEAVEAELQAVRPPAVDADVEAEPSAEQRRLTADADALKQQLLLHDEETSELWGQRDVEDGLVDETYRQRAQREAEALRAAVAAAQREQEERRRQREEAEQERVRLQKQRLVRERAAAQERRLMDQQYHSRGERQKRKEEERQRLAELVAEREARRRAAEQEAVALAGMFSHADLSASGFVRHPKRAKVAGTSAGPDAGAAGGGGPAGHGSGAAVAAEVAPTSNSNLTRNLGSHHSSRPGHNPTAGSDPTRGPNPATNSTAGPCPRPGSSPGPLHNRSSDLRVSSTAQVDTGHGTVSAQAGHLARIGVSPLEGVRRVRRAKAKPAEPTDM